MWPNSEVRIWCDNQGGEFALLKRAAKAEDHNLLAHGIWLTALRNDIGIYIRRVDTHSNIADDPSREEYSLLHAIGAKRIKPRIPREVWYPERWADWPSEWSRGRTGFQ